MHSEYFDVSKPKIDFSECAMEPIHIPGSIQEYGFMLVFETESLRIVQVSTNTYDHIRVKTENIIGRNLDEFLENYTLFALKKAIDTRDFMAFNPQKVYFPENRSYFDAFAHMSKELVILEFEPHAGVQAQENRISLLDDAFAAIRLTNSLTTLIQTAVQKIKAITGFDRVMCYKFDEDWNGQVIAEVVSEGCDTFLGLYFPATDIPAQARELYVRNQVRMIVQVGAPTSGLIGLDGFVQSPDMSDCTLRAVSPIHIEYLINMGVKATLSISLVHENKLWGMIVCHHESAKMLSYELRNSCKLLAQLVSSEIGVYALEDSIIIKRETLEKEELVFLALNHYLYTSSSSTNIAETLLNVNPEVSGAVLYLNGDLHAAGKVPPINETLRIIDWVSSKLEDEIYYTHKLPHLYPPAEPYKAIVSGLMVMRLSFAGDNYLIWFKPERLQEIHWGGNPQKAVVKIQGAAERLSPRKSFQKFTEILQGHAKRWTTREIRSLLRVRDRVKDILIMRHSAHVKALNEKLEKAVQDLEAFSYSVSHDLRSPLRTITNYTGILQEEFQEQLGEKGKKIIQTVLRGTWQMGELIRDLLEYARIGRVEKTLNTFALRPVLDDILQELLPQEDAHRQFDIQIDTLPEVYGDRPLLRQAFMNILSNALKYTRNKEVALIQLGATTSSEATTYWIRDNGIGFDPMFEPKIYQVFERLHDDSVYEGTGIGLALVYRILQSHAGSIRAESVPGEGTTFFMTLPKKK